MAIQKEKVPSFEEIVFEKRNKLYGAYLLRKAYNRNVTISLIIAVVVILIIVIPLFIKAISDRNIITDIDKSVVADLIDVDKPPEDEPPPPPPPPPPPALEQQVKFTAPIVVDTVDEKVELAVTEEIVQTTTNETIVEISDTVSTTTNKVIEEVEHEVFLVVEEMPVFPGGDEALIKYIQENIRYPDIAKENNITGRVFVKFVVNQEGNIEQVEVVRGVDPALDKEAVRVIKSLPKWTPGKQRGRSVKVSFTVPINFQLI